VKDISLRAFSGRKVKGQGHARLVSFHNHGRVIAVKKSAAGDVDNGFLLRVWCVESGYPAAGAPQTPTFT